ncbi:MAG: sugar phosphate isomerase/epimerase [Candidatus Omnitrophica bacterium]|nr:sugar phosphate isomerase/epimerase [Candidatus Omnitrophota bacterium]
MLAISTSWNYVPGGNLRECLQMIRDAGGKAVELGYRITNADLDSILPILQEFNLGVVSLHNFCPRPFDSSNERHPSNHYRLSSIHEEERQRAVFWTKNTIDMAVRVKASVVVIHAGVVDIPDDPCVFLLKAYKEGRGNLEDFEKLRQKVLAARRAQRGPFVDAVIKSLKEILPYAAQKNIKIGLETRYYPIEIPNFEEIGELLGLFVGQGLFYWHDVGHAEVNGRLGIRPQEDYLKHYHDKIIGWHLHGVQGIKDHLAPFQGDFDLEKVLPFVKAEHIKVIEASSVATVEQMKAAVEKFKKMQI